MLSVSLFFFVDLLASLSTLRYLALESLYFQRILDPLIVRSLLSLKKIIEGREMAVFNPLLESLGNTTATSVKTCSITIAFLLEDKDDYKL